MQLRAVVSLVLIAIRLCASPTFAQEKPLTPDEKREQAALFKWVDGFGLPDLSKYPVVEVTNSAWWPYLFGNAIANRACRHRYGLLLKEERDRFTVLYDSLITLTLTRSKDPEETSYRIVDSRALPQVMSQKYQANIRYPRAFGEGVFLSRVYALRGGSALADKMFRLLSNPFGGSGGDVLPLKEVQALFVANVQEHIHHLFIDKSTPLEVISEQASLLAKWFPAFQNLRQTLATMVKEEREHATKPSPPLDKLPLKERVAELIYQLRNDVGASEKLKKIGFPAVPQLIEAIDDPRIVRGESYLNTVGECAESAFAVITTFPIDYTGAPSRIEKKRKALAWWSAFQRKGERQTLIEITRRGDQQSEYAAEKLALRYPADATPAIATGLKNCRQPHTRDRLMDALANVNSDAAFQYARKAMWKEPSPPARLTAGELCWKKGDLSALNAIIEIWKREPIRPTDNSMDLHSLISFLSETLRPEAIEAMSGKFDALAPSDKFEVLEDAFRAMSPYDTPNPVNRATQKQRTEYAKELERLVAHTLRLTERIGVSGYGNYFWREATAHIEYDNLRLCDFAGAFLALMHPEKYPFDYKASLAIRERQRLHNIALWRKEHSKG